ncbi:hypothetical protein COLO4_23554 [Corchorus olitorius]|uniref:Uncharacterized protein n=1 Tax=Corchorus olitorius TaxID=93759 RepID=A0A1R3IFW5_9ROSI|nr:hypothetical protein COLO4_23554 [Corchorus olitorius]
MTFQKLKAVLKMKRMIQLNGRLGTLLVKVEPTNHTPKSRTSHQLPTS